LYQSKVKTEEEEELVPETPYLTHYLSKLFFYKNNLNYLSRVSILSKTGF
jgi:hypothetical protein